MSKKKSDVLSTVKTKRALPPKPKKVKIVPDEKEEVEDNEAEEVETNEGEMVDIKPKTRQKATMESHLANYIEVFALLDAEIDRKSREKEKGARSFRKVRKILKKMRKEVPQITRSKIGRAQSSTRKESTSGIMMKCSISEELAKFLGISPSEKLSRIDATRGICVYSHLKEGEAREEMLRWGYLNPGGKRNLQNQHDKKAIVPDAKLSKLLRYSEYKKNVAAGKITKKIKDKGTGKTSVVPLSSDSLYYWVIQKLITVHFLEDDHEDGQEEE